MLWWSQQHSLSHQMVKAAYKNKQYACTEQELADALKEIEHLPNYAKPYALYILLAASGAGQ